MVLALACAAGLAATPCAPDPFAVTGIGERESVLRRDCTGSDWNWAIDAPRPRPAEPGPNVLRARVEARWTQRWDDAASSTWSLRWAARRAEGGLRTEQATWALATRVKLSRPWALHVDLGQ